MYIYLCIYLFIFREGVVKGKQYIIAIIMHAFVFWLYTQKVTVYTSGYCLMHKGRGIS